MPEPVLGSATLIMLGIVAMAGLALVAQQSLIALICLLLQPPSVWDWV